ncbi:unnamed protein product [Heligmosomoides polygyrus]|uniref:Uncharacterized protein n=1 Tax=Heligmosomoides polygyrus TaxID=6339 RepID=A0A183F8W2_HELPZ|nr:unnamed protein product [Heligmosomoides polygyrus]
MLGGTIGERLDAFRARRLQERQHCRVGVVECWRTIVVVASKHSHTYTDRTTDERHTATTRRDSTRFCCFGFLSPSTLGPQLLLALAF